MDNHCAALPASFYSRYPDAEIIGLFGVARDNAQIYNITLRDFDIMSAGRNAAKKSAGAIVAIAYGGRAYDNAVVFTNE